MAESDKATMQGLVHDLNNRLTPVLGWLDMARYAHTEAELRECLAKAQANAPACLALIGQIRETLKPGAACPSGVCDPRPVLEQTLDNLRVTLPSIVHLVRNLWPNLHRVGLAAGGVDRVVFNLLDNARAAIVEAGQSRGTLTVLAHNVVVKPNAVLSQRGSPPKPGNYVLVSVRDDGPGMAEAVQARLLERGFTTKAATKGTGIGLVSVRDLLVAVGGGIVFKSASGMGTQFNVFLPVAAG